MTWRMTCNSVILLSARRALYLMQSHESVDKRKDTIH